ncbi:MAG: hypothetical protein COA79_07045 [Planctomycetota bacterium]|nr:MAG: hypothetical protein COA79_07045 [Planctomycetota bacterium]
MPYQQFDRFKLNVKNLSERPNKVQIENDFIPLDKAYDDYQGIQKEIFDETVNRIKTARENDKPVMLAFGAHSIKNGLGCVLQELISDGWVTHLATNGAGVIHDWEFSYQGKSSEDVKANVDSGQFGIWEETGYFINLAIVVGAFYGLGYGESVGAMIFNEGLEIPSKDELTKNINSNVSESTDKAAAGIDLLQKINEFKIEPGFMKIPHPFKKYSAQAKAYELKIPFTAHPMFGHDIIYNHPMNMGAAIGRTAEKDFLAYANKVHQLDGGVYLSVGSAVMSPMVFEKSLAMAQNIEIQNSRHIDNHYILVADLAKSDWDWKKGEPPQTDPAYYLRYCKTFSRMGGTMNYLSTDNGKLLTKIYQALS